MISKIRKDYFLTFRPLFGFRSLEVGSPSMAILENERKTDKAYQKGLILVLFPAQEKGPTISLFS